MRVSYEIQNRAKLLVQIVLLEVHFVTEKYFNNIYEENLLKQVKNNNTCIPGIF